MNRRYFLRVSIFIFFYTLNVDIFMNVVVFSIKKCFINNSVTDKPYQAVFHLCNVCVEYCM